VPEEDAESEANRVEVLVEVERHASKGSSHEGDAQNLNCDRDEGDGDKGAIIKESREHVECSVLNLTSVELVKHLEPHEQVEDHGEHGDLIGSKSIDCALISCEVPHAISCWNRWVCKWVSSVCLMFLFPVERIISSVLESEHIFASEEKNTEDSYLVERPAEDVSSHNVAYDRFVSVSWFSIENFLGGRFSGESEGSEGVHDKVDPQDLHRCHDGFIDCNSSEKNDNDGDNVNGELELQELTDAVVDVSAEHNAKKRVVKVVIEENNFRVALCSVRASCHSEADVRLVEGWRVVRSITSDSNDSLSWLRVFLDTADKNIFVSWRRAGKASEMGNGALPLGLVITW